MTTVVYFHGFASGRQDQSPKAALIRDLGYELLWVATAGDYRPTGYLAAFAGLKLDPAAPLVMMGTSLGGFWARRLGNDWGKPWIALNPAIQPSQSLQRYIGTSTRFDTGEPFNWTAADCAGYVDYEQRPLQPRIPGRLILAEDDEVLDYRPTLATAGAARVLVLPSGGHPLHNTGDYAAVIDEFLAESP